MAGSWRCWRRLSSHRPRSCRRRSRDPARRSFSKTTRSRCGMSRGSNRSIRFTRTATTWSGSPTRKAIGSSRRETRPGRLVPTKAWVFQTNRAGVTHVEEGASDPPMRAVLIEVKAAGSARRRARSRPDGLRQVAGAPAWENNRAAAWLVMGGSSAPTHRHVGDAVELIFDGDVAEGHVRPRWNGSRRSSARRWRARVHLRDQVRRRS